MSALVEQLVAARDGLKRVRANSDYPETVEAGVRALADAANKIVELETAIAAVRVLIGASNDTLTEAQRQGNINAAWHKLDAVHASDCATHNEPAYPNGPCDCHLAAKPLTPEQIKRARELLEDPDSEDNERFASWFGGTLLDIHDAYLRLATLQSKGG
jgi:hypothetical protein